MADKKDQKDVMDKIEDSVQEQANAYEASVTKSAQDAVTKARQENPELSDEELDKIADEGAGEQFDKIAQSMGLRGQEMTELKSAIDNGLPLGPILGRIAVASLNIWLVSEENLTKIVKYTQFDDLVSVIEPENGNVTYDYSTSTDIDGKNPYYGSIKDSGEDITKLWKQEKMEVGRESYQATLNYHKTVLTFKPLFTSTHKTVFLFMAQLNDIQKRLGEPMSRFEMAFKGRIVWLLDEAMDGITPTDDDMTIANTPAPDPDVEISAENMYSAIQLINNMFKWIVNNPSNTLFDDIQSALTANTIPGVTVKADMKNIKKVFAIKGMTEDIWRNISMDSLRILAPVEWTQAYNVVRAGLYQLPLGSLNETVESKIVTKNYNLFERFSKITGLKHDIVATGKDSAQGSVDLLIWTPSMLNQIVQYRAEETTDPGNYTTAINANRKVGVAINKYEDKFMLRVRLTVEPPKAPEQGE